MARYTTKSIFQADSDYPSSMTADSVIVSDDYPVDIGLFNANGEKLYRVKETVTLGFVGTRHNAKR